jgi:uncharacterized membrane protein YphA (DoxX/SURF4 family)
MTVYTLFLYIGIVALLLSAMRYFLAGKTNPLILFFQNFLGSLFIFSGFVKAVDPIGTSIKMHEYFEAMHLEFLDPYATPFAVMMLVAELALGVALLIGWWPKVTASLMLLLNMFFLLLTGYTYLSGYQPTAIFAEVAIIAFVVICTGAMIERGSMRMLLLGSGLGLVLLSLVLMKYSHILLTAPFDITKMKVTDCGCFGDFMKLKPWQTFYKDVILTCMSLILVLYYKHIQTLMSTATRHFVTAVTAVGALFLCLYNFVWNEPMIDFRPYALGSDIVKARIAERPEKRDFVFVYKNKKTNELKEYKTAELTGLSEDWEYKDRKDIILDEGVPARISNLYVFDQDHQDITDTLLQYNGYSLIVVAYKLSLTDAGYFESALNPLMNAAQKAGIKSYALTSEEPEKFRHAHNAAYPFYMADETPLKTMLRSNPGLILMKGGVIVNKWHKSHLPSFEGLNSMYFSKR